MRSLVASTSVWKLQTCEPSCLSIEISTVMPSSCRTPFTCRLSRLKATQWLLALPLATLFSGCVCFSGRLVSCASLTLTPGGICQEWLTLFPQSFSMLCCSPDRVIILPAFEAWRHATYGCAYPPVIPVAHVVSPDKLLDRSHGHFRRIISVVKQFFLHPGPHAFATGIVMAPASGRIHALYKTIFLYGFAVFITDVLSAAV